MSDSFVYSNVNSFIVPENDSKVKKSDLKFRFLKVFVGILCVILVFEIILYTIIIPTLVPAKISFSGLQMYTPEEMCKILNITANETWIEIDAASIATILSECSWIDSVSVEKRFPDTINISVAERIPVAITLIDFNGKTVPVQIDRNGVLFFSKKGASLSHLPLISGLPLNHYVDGMRLHNKYRVLMNQLADIQSLQQNYLATISEIHVNLKENDNYELVIYPIHSQIKILTDRTLNEDVLQYMVVGLDVINSIEPDVDAIDLRYGSVSFRKKNMSKSEIGGKF